MSDRIVVMEGGRIAQVGTPGEIYDRPANRFVAAFIGESNFLDVTAVGRDGATLLLHHGASAAARRRRRAGGPREHHGAAGEDRAARAASGRGPGAQRAGRHGARRDLRRRDAPLPAADRAGHAGHRPAAAPLRRRSTTRPARASCRPGALADTPLYDARRPGAVFQPQGVSRSLSRGPPAARNVPPVAAGRAGAGGTRRCPHSCQPAVRAGRAARRHRQRQRREFAGERVGQRLADRGSLRHAAAVQPDDGGDARRKAMHAQPAIGMSISRPVHVHRHVADAGK